MDKETIEEVKEELTKIAEDSELEIEKAIVFGSRAREDYRDKSDVDIIIVSPDFENKPWNKRSVEFYLGWNYDNLPTPEIICLTPEEFEEKSSRDPNIVHTAVSEGVSIA